MVKCLYGLGTDKHCKSNGYPFCKLHRKLNNKICEYCKKKTPDMPKIRLSKCAHLMCVNCFVTHVLDVQFFENFSTMDPLFCPCCIEKISKPDWNLVISVLVKMKIIQPECVFRNDVYNTYRIIYKKYKPPDSIDESYRIRLTNKNVYI